MLILLVWWPHFANHCLGMILDFHIQSIRKCWFYTQKYAESDHKLGQATIMPCLHYYNSLLTDLSSSSFAFQETSVRAARMALLKQKRDCVTFQLHLCHGSSLHSDQKPKPSSQMEVKIWPHHLLLSSLCPWLQPHWIPTTPWTLQEYTYFRTHALSTPSAWNFLCPDSRWLINLNLYQVLLKYHLPNETYLDSSMQNCNCHYWFLFILSTFPFFLHT